MPCQKIDDQKICEDRRQLNTHTKIEDKIEAEKSVFDRTYSTRTEPSIAAKIQPLVQSNLSISGRIIKSKIAGSICKEARGGFKKRERGKGNIKKIKKIILGQSDQHSDQSTYKNNIMSYFKPVPTALSLEKDLINRKYSCHNLTI